MKNTRRDRRLTYLVIERTSLGLHRRLLEIRTALPLEPRGRRARCIARALGGDFLRRGDCHV